jgi:biotin operon repressor
MDWTRRTPRQSVVAMTLAERVLSALTEAGGRGLDDDELGRQLGVARQAVNQTCRSLAARGTIVRGALAGGKILNRLPRAGVVVPPPPPAARPTARPAGALLTEDEVKAAVLQHLEERGWTVTVAWGRARGADIVAHRQGERLVLEAKGEVGLQPQQVNYFLGALGELLQRMDDPHATYGLALPDNRQYRGLVGRLPLVAIERLGLVVYFVERAQGGYRVEVI